MVVRQRIAPDAAGVRRAAADVASSLFTALGRNDAGVRVVLPDGAGRLRVVASTGKTEADGRRAADRRRAFETGRPIVLSAMRGEPWHAIVPLVAEQQTLGVVEVVAPGERLKERRGAVLALVRQSATLLKVSQERAASDRSTDGLERLLGLIKSLAAAPTADAAMRAVADTCSEHLDAPVAVVRPDRSRSGWYVAATAGMGRRTEARLRALLQLVPRPTSDDAREYGVAAAFREVTRRRAQALTAGDALVVTDERHARSRVLRGAVWELEVALRLLTAHDDETEIEFGMAWTAHELRRPLVGAKAALEVLLTSGEKTDRDLLRRTKAELDSLTDLVDPLLEYSVRGRTEKHDADLVTIVRAAVASSCIDGERDRIVMNAPEQVPIRADVLQLRSAVANIVRNALTYSPASMPVEVAVDRDSARARVTVLDRGPGIAMGERSTIFDPFVRGTVGREMARGNGLGLFIARRVAETHGGSVRLDDTTAGARFCLELPISTEDIRASAS